VRHDPASAAVVVMLRSLKMYGMAQAVSDLTEQGAPAFDTAVPILSQLLKAELAEREVRSVAYQIKAARFPAYREGDVPRLQTGARDGRGVLNMVLARGFLNKLVSNKAVASYLQRRQPDLLEEFRSIVKITSLEDEVDVQKVA